MNTDEIIRRLDLIGESYKSIAAELLPESEVSACMEAKNLAIQAVKVLEEAKKALEGTCTACKRGETLGKCPACQECIEAHRGINWEFRWPLGKDAAT